MCGICGWVRWEGGVELATVRRMTQRLVHRGPDGEGLWIDPAGRAAFGHRRLAVLDLSGRAAQPMVSAAGAVLAYNGEVYGFRELRRRLEREGVAFQSSGDTEVVLAALEREGSAGLDRLDGMFALALWDPRGRLLLARDRLGIKPLFWAEVPGGLVFASEVPALLEHPSVGRELDRESLGRWLQLGYVPGSATLLASVHRLEPGTCLECGPEGIRNRRWYDVLDAAARREPPRSRDEAVEALETEIAGAVRRRLVADVPLGAFLSSGVDSSLVAAVAAGDRELETLTVRFEGGADESVVARRTAERLGTLPRVETLDPAGMLGLLERWPDIAADPFADPSLAPTALVCRAARRRWTVALSGDGGDELFSGYPRLRAMPRVEKAFGVPGPLRSLAGNTPLPGRRWAGKLRAALHARDLLEAYQALQGLWPREMAAALLGAAPPDPWPAGTVERIGGLGPWTRWRALDLLTFLPERVLAKVDRASMAHSLEVRVPLVDHRVVECALSLRPELVQGKGLLRAVLGRRVSGLGLPRRKLGFEVPLARWLRGPLHTEVERSLDDLPELGLDPGPARTALTRHLSGAADLAEPLFALWLLTRWDAAVRRA